MELLLMRHGQAVDDHPDGDWSRALTPKGQQQAQRQAERLTAAGLLPHIVLCSPLVRARETAESFCAGAQIPGPLVQGWLSCGMSPASALSELAGFREFERIMLVGHEPDCSNLVATLINSSAMSVRMKKATIASLTIQPPSQRGVLNFVLPAKKGL